MFIGHYAPALVAASSRKSPPLGLMIVAVQLLDFAFFSFALIGVEHFRLVPNITASNWLDLYDMPYSHSLLGAGALAAGFAGLAWLLVRSRAAALIAAAMVLSHWLIDYLVHRPDLTLAGHPPLLGLGLWNMPLIEKPLELAMAFGTLAFYIVRTRPGTSRAMLALALFAAVLALVQAIDWFGPRTTVVDSGQPLTALAAYSVIAALAVWLQATRTLRI
jgi:hypothetical protein